MSLLSLFLPKRSGIPVLMYHKVEHESHDSLTVSISDFKCQMAWLKNEGFETISLRTFLDFLEQKKKRTDLPKKPVLITFDDGYLSTLNDAGPVLAAHQFQATLFATSAFIDGTKKDGDAAYLNPNELQKWASNGNDIALHSHEHLNFKQSSFPKIVHDLKANQAYFKSNEIPVQAVLAYPYGARPKDKETKKRLKKFFKDEGIQAAFRIGNRVATWSSLMKRNVDRYELPRIDVRGDDTIESFSIKVQKGRLRPFQ